MLTSSVLSMPACAISGLNPRYFGICLRSDLEFTCVKGGICAAVDGGIQNLLLFRRGSAAAGNRIICYRWCLCRNKARRH